MNVNVNENAIRNGILGYSYIYKYIFILIFYFYMRQSDMFDDSQSESQSVYCLLIIEYGS